MLLQAAISIVGAEGVFSNTKRSFIQHLGQRLALPPGFVDRTLERMLFGQEDSEEEIRSDIDLARMILGLDRHATLSDVKRRYREHVLACHPDVAAVRGIGKEQAEEITKQLNWAYAVMKGDMLQHAESAH